MLEPAAHDMGAVMRHAPSPLQPDDVVLVVDDDPAVRSIITWRVGCLGCTVAEAASAEEALASAEALGWNISVLVTDISMPGTSGLLLGATLARRCAALRVLYVTGHMADDIVGDAAPPCAWAVLEKPFDTRALSSAITELMVRTRA